MVIDDLEVSIISFAMVFVFREFYLTKHMLTGIFPINGTKKSYAFEVCSSI